MRFQIARLILVLSVMCVTTVDAQFTSFITRSGDRLMDGNREFRFISMNIPNLHYLEDALGFESTNPWRLPDEFEIRDALGAIKQMGGKVTRMYVLSVRRENDAPGIVRHIEGPEHFNEEAFVALDRVLQVANDLGVRVIIPFVDNWKWWGGPVEYAGFRGKSPDAFWTDPQVIADVKATIAHLVNRRNTLTGILYKDDKAVLAWETGNELDAPFSWTREIAAYVKSLDTNHLVMEGIRAASISDEAIADPHLDILSTHHYGDPMASLERIVENRRVTRGKKPYIIGEYGIIPFQDIRAITDTIIRQGISGGLLWSLRFHNRDGGWYHHYEYNGYSAYHWPGLSGGDANDEREVMNLVYEKGHEIDGTTPPRLSVPSAPMMLDSDDPQSLSWRGSVGARYYQIERRDGDGAPWVTVADRVVDDAVQYGTLFHDESVLPERRYYYRVKAVNESGTSESSAYRGTTTGRSLCMVDELGSFDKVFQKEGSFTFLSQQDVRRAKEDRSRLAGSDGSYVMYKVPATVDSVRVDAFDTGSHSRVEIAVDSTVDVHAPARIVERRYAYAANDYGFFDACSFSAAGFPAGSRYVKVICREGLQLTRVTIWYSRHDESGARP